MWFPLWWLVYACSCSSLLPDACTGPRKRNFIVIIADDMGNDKVGVYGESPHPPPTPTLDALAAEGVWFRNAYVAPVCSASRAMLLTGRYGRRTGVSTIVSDYSKFGLQPSEITIPEALDRGRDWSAAALGKWHLTGRRSPQALRDPLEQGFDRMRGSMGNVRKRGGGLKSYSRWEKNVDGDEVMSTTYATTDTTDEAILAMSELPEPFFLWVAYNVGHEPFHWPPGMKAGKGHASQYDAMMSFMDQEIGRMLAAMTAGQRARTTVVFVGDNGTARGAIRAPYRAVHGKSSLFEGGTNVPLIVAGAGVTGRGESQALVSGADLLPTLLDLAGVSSADLTLDGVSFRAQLTDPDAPGARRFVYTEHLRPNGPPPYNHDDYAIRDDRYKLMHGKGGGWKRYDLESRYDDGERLPEDVAPERFEALAAEAERIRDTVRFDRSSRDGEGAPE